MEFGLLAICIIATIVLLLHNRRYEAGNAIWCGAIASALVSCDLSDALGQIMMIGFASMCLWLMWYMTPHLSEEPMGGR